ncbi:MAG TPA: Mov34/MPN/PAD-1 family protein [Bryobacteraceae bacterium]|nr:Mov34/MPN/PAD-1 family protein [Bryobacteraceae bacterium]
MESHTASDVATWKAPQCAVTVEYSLRVLDDIRLAVVEAFFSLPRGGAEIGGLLLGKHAGGKVTIQDYRPLDCEHAYGPSFTLSPKDQVRLAELLASISGEAGGLEPVGWYHSHTRSEILLSEPDQEIHQQYFPEPWHVALVLKPHTFQPTRAGFFFREADGSFHGASSRGEFVVEPLGAPRGPDEATTPRDPDVPVTRREPAIPMPLRNGANGDVREAVEEAPAQALEQIHPPDRLQEMPRPDVPAVPAFLPSFTHVAPESSRNWWSVVLAILAGLAIGAGAYQTRQVWLAPVAAWLRPGASPGGAFQAGVAPYLGLRTIDTDGQLWILWDRNAPTVRGATGGTLVIHDVSETRSVPLDAAHLQAGSFTYGREGEQVDLTLTVNGPNGESASEVATYLGKLPPRLAPLPDPVREERDSLAKKTEKLTTDLNAEKARSRKLSDRVTQLTRDQRRRLGNQAPDAGK